MVKVTAASVIALCTLACTNAFAPSGMKPLNLVQTTSPTYNSNSPITKLRMADVASEIESKSETAVLPTPAMMDEGIYKFNKVLIDSVYNVICFFYPVTGTKRDFARFYVLETVARVPYFAYLSVMHLRETFGERGLGESMRTHYAEADNELHHLLIMESLGGNENAIDRTLAQTMAFGYYWYVIAIYFFNEPAAYHLSELIEDHAFDTYNGFLTEYEEKLKGMPVPAIATKYYVEDNPYMFDTFCTVKEKEATDFSARRPTLNSLYDVFVNVRDDEKEHWKTLCNLVQFGDMQAIPAEAVESTKPMPKVD